MVELVKSIVGACFWVVCLAVLVYGLYALVGGFYYA